MNHAALVGQLKEDIRAILMTQFGKTIEDASEKQLYQAYGHALRATLTSNWWATWETYKQKKAKIAYYLSMEYLPGKLSQNNLFATDARQLSYDVAQALGRGDVDLWKEEPDPALGNGGLGRLASCLLLGWASLQYPCMGYGLRYQYGLFKQTIDDQQQHEIPDCWLLAANPWEIRRDERSTFVHFYEKDHYQEVHTMAYDIPIVGYQMQGPANINTLRLWSCKESPKNFHFQSFDAGELDQAYMNTALTDILYPNDSHCKGQRQRFKQEVLLSFASVNDILTRVARNDPSLETLENQVHIQINDTHPALAIIHMLYRLQQYGWQWHRALETVQTIFGYTNHTILREAMEQWPTTIIQSVSPQHLEIIQKIDAHVAQKSAIKIIENERVSMAPLSFSCSKVVNGVAKIHTDILKNNTFSDLNSAYPNRLIPITNGVDHRFWIDKTNPKLAACIDAKIGRGWRASFEEIHHLAECTDAETLNQFHTVKQNSKKNLLQFLKEHNLLTPVAGMEEWIFDVHIKRIHSYKRQIMNIFSAYRRYLELKKGIDFPPKLVLISGKAASSYFEAKACIHFIHRIAHRINSDPAVADRLKVVFIPNYNVSLAQQIIPAADLSQQISTAGYEASGTGNMKLAMHGALTIGTEDGANIEMRQAISDKYWPFAFGATADEVQKIQHTPEKIVSQPEWSFIQEILSDQTDLSSYVADQMRCLYHTLCVEDRYLVTYDLPQHYEACCKADALYKNSNAWQRFALHQIAGMHSFSIDTTAQRYASAWGLDRVPVDPAAIAKIQEIVMHYSNASKSIGKELA